MGSMEDLVVEFLTSPVGKMLYQVARNQGKGGMETGVQAAFHAFMKVQKKGSWEVEREVKYFGESKCQCDLVCRSKDITAGIELKVERGSCTDLKAFENELSLDILKLFTEPLISETLGKKFQMDTGCVLGLVWSAEQWDVLNQKTNNLTDATFFEQRLQKELNCEVQLIIKGTAPISDEWGYIMLTPS